MRRKPSSQKRVPEGRVMPAGDWRTIPLPYGKREPTTDYRLLIAHKLYMFSLDKDAVSSYNIEVDNFL